MKVTVIGGGSSYTPELVLGFLNLKNSFPLETLYLMDTDVERLTVIGSLTERMLAARDADFKVVLSTDMREAISGSSYIITQIRVGGMAARREDEYLGLRHGLVGQETTGIGGMANALRTIPVMLEIANLVDELAPDALLVNFTNPAGVNTEALATHRPNVKMVGVCNVPITAKMLFLDLLECARKEKIDPDRVQLKTLGLNHLTWHYGLSLDGEDVWPEILDLYCSQDEPEWDPALIRNLGMIPSYYMMYFYQTKHKIAEQTKWPPSRAEEVMQIEADLMKLYQEEDRQDPPEDLMKRGGAYYSTMATRLLNAHYNDLGEVHVTNVLNGNAVPAWPSDWVIEAPCKVNRNGIAPLSAESLPADCAALVAQVKAFEKYCVQAAVYGDRDALYRALLAHPLGPDMEEIPAIIDDLLSTNRAYLPQFFKDA
jgi:6-phospho-beta-glucosidase